MRSILLPLVLASLTIATSLAQDFRPGFIVTLQGDTIRGEVKFGHIRKYKECVFKNNDGESKTYSSYEIQAYGIDKIRLYSSQVIDSTFFEVLGIGVMSLYKNDDYYLVKKEGESNLVLDRSKLDDLIPEENVRKNQYRGSIKYLISDCLQDFDARRIRITESGMLNILKKYNRCVNSDFYEVKNELPNVTFEIGSNIGYNFYSLKNTFDGRFNQGSPFGYRSFPSKFSTSGLSYGFDLIMKFPKKSDNLSVRVGVIFNGPFAFESKKDATYQGDPVTYSSEFEFSFTSFPLVFGYDVFKNQSITFRMLLGAQYSIFTQRKSLLEEDKAVLGDLFDREYVNEYDMKNTSLLMGGFEIFLTSYKFNYGVQAAYLIAPLPDVGGVPSHDHVATQIRFINISFFIRYQL